MTRKLKIDNRTMAASLLQSPSSPSNTSHLVVLSPAPENTRNSTKENNASSQSQVAANLRTATRNYRRTSKYLGYVTWTTIDGWTGVGGGDDDDDDDEEKEVQLITYRKEIFSLRLPFTSIQLDLENTSAMGNPSYALNVTHIITRNSDLGRRICSLLLRKGGTGELHRLLSKRELSMYSLCSMYNSEMNLFWVCTTYAINVAWHFEDTDYN